MAGVGDFAVFIPITALLIPVAAIVGKSMQNMAKIRLEEARIRAGAGAGDDVQQLREEVDQLRGELVEMQERLDFTERLLAKGEQDKRP